MGLTALCPGTFDPVTNGHLDIIGRAAETFDAVIVGALENPSKQPMFTLEERVAMLKEACSGVAGVSIVSFRGLLVDFARAEGVDVIVKGLRAVSDYEYEIQMAQMNHRLAGVETVFMPTNPSWSFLSSSLVKEVAKLGGDVAGLVPDHVRSALADRFVGPREPRGGPREDRGDAGGPARGDQAGTLDRQGP
jgi:pantetheine-phosphate adenylyltransferase